MTSQSFARPARPTFFRPLPPPVFAASTRTRLRQLALQVLERTPGNCPLQTHVVMCGFPRSGSTLLQLVAEACYPQARAYREEKSGLNAAKELIRTHGVRRDRRGFPTAYVWIDNEPNGNGRMYALVEGIEGLAPRRERSLDEFGRGIESLDPPIVVATDWNDLVDLALEATDEAIRSTLGADLSIGEALMVRYKTACMVRGCLRDAGIDA